MKCIPFIPARSRIILLTTMVLFFTSLTSSFAQGVRDSIFLETDTINVLRLPSDEDWDFFDSEKLLKLSLSFDQRQFIKQKHKEEYQDAVLRIFIDQEWIERDIRIRARGERRRVLCSLPPIKFNFKKVDSTDVYLGDETTLKLVTWCKDFGEYPDLVLKEFLVYKMYNVLTDFSYKVRLVEIEYIDTGRKNKSETRYGFLIEHLRDVANRNKAYELGKLNLTQKMLDKQLLSLMGVFHFMIGNTDWSIQGPHNVRFIRLKDVNRLAPIAIPYDFDYSGIVGADYAVPTEGLPIDDIRDRYYFVYCLPEDVMMESFELFKNKRDEIYQVVETFSPLDIRERDRMTRYLEGFFEILDSERLTRQRILNACLDK